MTRRDMTPEPDDVRIERWLGERSRQLPHPDRDAVLRDALHQLPTTPQRWRWWPFRWFLIGIGATRSTDPTEPRPEGRSRDMFSAVRIAAVVAIVALGGSLALIAGPLGPSAGPALVPGAEAPSPEPPVRVTGSSRGVAIEEPGTETVEDGVAQLRGRVGRNEPEMNDPRVNGTIRYVHNSDDHGGMGPTWGTLRLVNDDGAWEGVVSGYWYGPETRTAGWLEGEGAYEGLSYYHESVLDHSSLEVRISGIIYPGDPPEDPPTFE